MDKSDNSLPSEKVDGAWKQPASGMPEPIQDDRRVLVTVMDHHGAFGMPSSTFSVAFAGNVDDFDLHGIIEILKSHMTVRGRRHLQP